MFAITLAALALASVAHGQPVRKDVIWARSTNGAPITLDGVLNEPGWAVAESTTIIWQQDTGIPGSGWKAEGGILPSNPVRATVRFLTNGNRLYLSAVVVDASIGGSETFNYFDGLLMQIKDRTTGSAPASPAEYFYSWWHPEDPTPRAIGKMPGFRGKFGSTDDVPRTVEQIDMWDAVTTVTGFTNADDIAGGADSTDSRYTVEMMFNLTGVGYDITPSAGDVIPFNISVYDCDWLWPQTFFFSANRTWWQGPWGNSHGYNSVRIHAKPSVTVSSGPVPVVGPELTIPNGAAAPAPVINGQLDDAIWATAPHFDIRYGDPGLRQTYPSVGKEFAGEYQPPIGTDPALVTDPADATVYYFFRADSIYLGFDVRDQVVQYSNDERLYDGARVSINEYSAREAQDHVLLGRRLTFQVGPTGALKPLEYLVALADTIHGARAAIYLKPGTAIENPAVNIDNGYQAEMLIDLTKLGYPAGRGDGRVFLGINLFDGDQYEASVDTYGNHAWWFREYDNTSGPVFAYMDPTVSATGVGDEPPIVARLTARGVYPNPFRLGAQVRFSLPRSADVKLEVFDLSGRRMISESFAGLPAGEQQVPVVARGWPAGVYHFRLSAHDGAGGVEPASITGRMLRLR
jgi:hypothetical protein